MADRWQHSHRGCGRGEVMEMAESVENLEGMVDSAPDDCEDRFKNLDLLHADFVKW